MSIVLTGTKTVTTDVSPTITAAVLTALMAKAPETYTLQDLETLNDALHRVKVGDEMKTIGQLLL